MLQNIHLSKLRRYGFDAGRTAQKLCIDGVRKRDPELCYDALRHRLFWAIGQYQIWIPDPLFSDDEVLFNVT